MIQFEIDHIICVIEIKIAHKLFTNTLFRFNWVPTVRPLSECVPEVCQWVMSMTSDGQKVYGYFY